MTIYTDFASVPADTYDVILSDPPWFYFGSPTKMGAAGKEYDLMTDADLAAMPVRAKCRDRAVLLMWATCPRLDFAMKLMEQWGFTYRGVAFVWVKTTVSGKVIHGQGVRPTVVKPTTELVLVGSTKKLGRPLPVFDEGVGQVVLAPRGAHSQKPVEVRARIESLFGPGVKRLEMFARGSTVNGWDRFGNELTPEASNLDDLLGMTDDGEEDHDQEEARHQEVSDQGNTRQEDREEGIPREEG